MKSLMSLFAGLFSEGLSNAFLGNVPALGRSGKYSRGRVMKKKNAKKYWYRKQREILRKAPVHRFNLMASANTVEKLFEKIG